MEVYEFSTNDVSRKLSNIFLALNALSFIIGGMRLLELIDLDEHNSFNFVLCDALDTSKELLKSIKLITDDESQN